MKITNPDFLSFKLESRAPLVGMKCVYEITSRTEPTYKQEFTNHADGIDVLVSPKLPMGGSITIRGKWRVVDGKLEGNVGIDGNFVVKLASGFVHKMAPEQHK
jgi:hypothetical protein